MMWSYRALNNPVARRKWFLLVVALIAAGFGYTAYKVSLGYPVGRALIVASIFALFVSLYAIITLGKPRHYFIEGSVVYYRPLKVDLRRVEGYEVDEKRLVIRLKGIGLFGVRTLYFNNLDDLRKVEKHLKELFLR